MSFKLNIIQDDPKVESLKQLLDNIKNNQYKSQDNNISSFVECCISLKDKTSSQNFQDIWALYENNFKRDGYFIEFGATDGIVGSNSVLLEKEYGWKGILAEPNPFWHENLFKNRSNNISKKCVFSETGSTLDFLMTDAADLSTIKGFGTDDEWAETRMNAKTIQVETISLYDLLKEYNSPKNIDYLSIDTEGTEYQILEAFFLQNNDEYSIKTITVEHNFTPIRNMLFELMIANGYKRVFTEISKWDDFYIK